MHAPMTPLFTPYLRKASRSSPVCAVPRLLSKEFMMRSFHIVSPVPAVAGGKRSLKALNVGYASPGSATK